uniref:Gag-pol polyprotein n=1 Tax=Solanum tuberosum TaxID=4113 RepID=M1DGR7_SOLTU
MSITRRSKSTGKRVDVAAQEGTSQPPPSQAVQVATMGDRVHRYVDRLDSYLVRACTIASLNKDIDVGRMQAFAQKLEDQRQRRRTLESETGHSKRARSMGQFTPSQGEFRPWFFNRPPRPSSSYLTVSAPPQFQGSRGNQFGQRGESKGSRTAGYQEQGSRGQMRTGRGREARGAASSSGVQNRTYALGDRQNLEASPDMVTVDWAMVPRQPKVPVGPQPRQGTGFLADYIGRIAEPLGDPDLARP